MPNAQHSTATGLAGCRRGGSGCQAGCTARPGCASLNVSYSRALRATSTKVVSFSHDEDCRSAAASLVCGPIRKTCIDDALYAVRLVYKRLPDMPPTVIELFERQVAATPEAVALVDTNEELTYAELAHRANR